MKKTSKSNRSKTSRTRRRYTAEFKTEALALSARVGAATAAEQLGLETAQLYAWRSQARRQQDRGEAERQLATENARLKRQLAERDEELAILKKAAAYFAKQHK